MSVDNEWTRKIAELEASVKELEAIIIQQADWGKSREEYQRRIGELESLLKAARDVIENLYSCKYEPDKMLCIVERWRQIGKAGVK